MRTEDATLAQTEVSYRKARRTVIGHLVFFLGCCILAVVLRQVLRYPPLLSWVMFAVPAVVFAGDITRFVYYRFKLRRFR